MSRISQAVDYDTEKNIHKVVYDNKKTIVSCNMIEGKIHLPKGAKGQTISKGFAMRVGDTDWDTLEWLTKEEVQDDELDAFILWDVIAAYKDNIKKKQYLSEQ